MKNKKVTIKKTPDENLKNTSLKIGRGKALGSGPKAREVICLNTKETFKSATLAGKKYGRVMYSMLRCCSNKTTSCGETDSEFLAWMYLDEYKKASKEEIQEKILKANDKKVILLNTGETFKTSLDASQKYNISSDSICICCRGTTSSAGAINDEKAIWMYYNDYLKSNKKHIKEKLEKNKDINKRTHSKEIVCLNTGETFPSIISASKHFNIPFQSISYCCLGQRKSGGKINGEPARWMFLNEYLEMKNK